MKTAASSTTSRPRRANSVRKLYNALAERFGGILDGEAAEQGLEWFAEHVADAQANPGKHPNIDLLFKVKNEGLKLRLRPLVAD